jgi:hypothetical protein
MFEGLLYRSGERRRSPRGPSGEDAHNVREIREIATAARPEMSPQIFAAAFELTSPRG